jgi:hypothetical protein
MVNSSGAAQHSLFPCAAGAASATSSRIYNLTYVLSGTQAVEQEKFYISGISLRINATRILRGPADAGFARSVAFVTQVLGCRAYTSCNQLEGGDLKATEGVDGDWLRMSNLPISLTSSAGMSSMVEKWNIRAGAKMYVDRRCNLAPGGTASCSWKLWIPVKKWITSTNGLISGCNWNVYFRISGELLGDGTRSASAPSYNYATTDVSGAVYYSY